VARDGEGEGDERATDAEWALEALFDLAQVGMFRSKVDGSGFLDVNRKVCELLEGTREQVLGLAASDVWTNLEAREAMKKALLEEGVAEVEAQVTTLRGNVKTLRGTFILHREAGFVEGTVVDVTARHLAEERLRASLREKEVLLREIHHRVKNNLQIVSSLLYLQSTRIEDARLRDVLRDSQNRVMSMALLHQQLYESYDLSEIPFASYVTDLARTLYHAHGVSTDRVGLVVRGADVVLTLDVAVPCGLVLNELLSNALKHAYPGDVRGTISVEIERDGDGYRMRVSDDGVGLPEDFVERAKTSLGTKLVERLVAQLGGTLSRTTSSAGTSFEVRFPAERDVSGALS
jgi:PAS domain S-box-containing protein